MTTQSEVGDEVPAPARLASPGPSAHRRQPTGDLRPTEPPCPICDRTTRGDFEIRGHWIRACNACDHRFAELAPTTDHAATVYDDAYFTDGGAGYPRYLDQARIVHATGRFYERLARRHLDPGVVLDVGAAAAFVLKAFVDAGWRGTGLEPNDSMAAYGRERLGLDVRTGTLETFESTERYDLVTMIQVLPHLWDLRRALETAASVTAPGGHWLIETWDRGSLTARVLGRRWHEYSPPSVLHWFDRDGVVQLAAQYGFHEVDHGRRLKWILGSHAVSLVKYKTEGTPLEGLVDRLGRLVPARLPYPSEDLFWILLRKDADGLSGR